MSLHQHEYAYRFAKETFKAKTSVFTLNTGASVMFNNHNIDYITMKDDANSPGYKVAFWMQGNTPPIEITLDGTEKSDRVYLD